MALEHADLRDAGWLREGAGGDEVWHVGPAGFAAYARVRLIPDPAYVDQDETDADVPEHHPDDVEQIARAVEALGADGELRLAVWEGWPGRKPERLVSRGPGLLELPHRRFVLLTGTYADLRDWGEQWEWSVTHPALVWPVHRSWCLACDVDPHRAMVAGSAEAVARVLADLDLDVVPWTPGEPVPSDG